MPLRICEQVLVNKRSRENAEKTRLNLKKKLSGSIDLANRVQKFVDCRSKDPAEREIYIVEGDSALGACKLGRDAQFQAIIPVRGKILNCLKAEYDKIFKNDIITDIIKVLGCGVEVRKQGQQGAVHLRPRQPALEQDRHLYRCRCGRLPDPHPDPDHALPSDPHPDRTGVCLYCRVAAL